MAQNETQRQLERLDMAGRVADLALETLAALSAPEWAELASVARRHTAGEIGPEAWRTFSGAVLARPLAEVETYGALGIGQEKERRSNGNGKANGS